MTFVATENFLGVERLIKGGDPEAQKIVMSLPAGQGRQLLRYQAGEINRYFFEAYGFAQITLAVLVAGVLLFATTGNRVTTIFSGVLILITLFEYFFLTKELASLGQQLAFHPNDLMQTKFHDLHTAFGWTEAVKGILLMLVGAKLLIKREYRHSGNRRSNSLDHEPVATYR